MNSILTFSKEPSAPASPIKPASIRHRQIRAAVIRRKINNMDNPQNSAKFSQQPKGERIEFLKSVVSSKIDERRDSDDSGPPLCDEEFTRMREIVSAEYDKWVKALGLEPVPLDVYGYCKTSDVKTQHGTDVTNGTPGYDGHIIVMPLWPKTTREQGIVLPEFPPSSWRESPQIWPEWRTNLLHEVVHQLEDKVLHIWSGEENPRTYLEALKEAAARLSRIKTVALDDLETLTWPQLTNRIKLSSPSISDSKPSNVEHENGKNSKFQS